MKTDDPASVSGPQIINYLTHEAMDWEEDHGWELTEEDIAAVRKRLENAAKESEK